MINSPQEPDERAPTRDSFLARLRALDADTWAELDRRYRVMIAARARGAGLNEADAQDVVQNVFAAMAQNPPGPSPRPGSFRAWIRELTRWKITDRLREVGRLKARHVDGGFRDTSTDPIQGVPAPDEFSRGWDRELDQHLHDLALDRVARKVRPKAFQAFQLTQYQGWEPSRVAKELGMATATVYVQRFRVLKRMEEELALLCAEVDSPPR